MMKTKSIIAIIALIFSFIECYAQNENMQSDFPILTGLYLGQVPPGIIPEVFAPGIVTKSDYFEHSAVVFSADGKQLYWSAKPNGERYFKIFTMRMVDGEWQKPKLASFSEENKNYGAPVLAPDGDKLFFSQDGEIWFVERKSDSWDNGMKVSMIVNIPEQAAGMCSITNNGSIYFIKYPEFEIYISRQVNGTYVKPIKLDKQINFGNTRKMSVYVAPNENYMIIESSKDAATCELFISFKQENGLWSECSKLPIIWGRFPSVSPDGKYLFFMTRDGIYWVSSEIINSLKQKPKN